jgi:hypothetical protein
MDLARPIAFGTTMHALALCKRRQPHELARAQRLIRRSRAYSRVDGDFVLTHTILLKQRVGLEACVGEAIVRPGLSMICSSL